MFLKIDIVHSIQHVAFDIELCRTVVDFPLMSLCILAQASC